jgi:hypothetical protein
MINAYVIFVGKPERKKPCGEPRRRQEDMLKGSLGMLVSE